MIYSFQCDPESGGCGESFEISCYISEYDAATKNIKCPKCNNKNNVIRDYLADKPHSSIKLSESELTVSHLAHRNTERLSDDEKAYLNYKHHEYLYNDAQDLPEGMTRTRVKPKEGYLPIKTTNKRKRNLKRRSNNAAK